MTIPLWAPFALLAAISAFYPKPRWMRRIDWLLVGCWMLFVSFSVGVWVAVGLLIGTVV